VPDDRRVTIREIALELFSRNGYEKTSLREIAEHVGMTKASLYYHYPSKQALLLAILEPLIAEWHSVADKTETLPHTPANVRLVLRQSLDVMLRHRPIAGLFVRDAAAVVAAIGPVYEDIVEVNKRLITWLSGPSPSPADQVRAHAATEVLSTALGWSLSFPDISDDELRSVLLECAGAVLRLRGRARP
jgi:AcrR family transcriptional regulator